MSQIKYKRGILHRFYGVSESPTLRSEISADPVVILLKISVHRPPQFVHYGVYQRYYSLQTNSISGCCNDITISWQLFYFWRRVQFLFKERGPLLSFGANCFRADNSNRGPLLISILAQNDVTLFYGVICLSYFFFTTRTTPLVCDYKLACINIEGS